MTTTAATVGPSGPAALVIGTPVTQAFRVAGLTPGERFARALTHAGASWQQVDAVGLAGALAAADQPVAVFDGDAVFEHDPIPRILEAPCDPNAVVAFVADGFGTAPAVRLGHVAARALADAPGEPPGSTAQLQERALALGLVVQTRTLEGTPFWRTVRDRHQARQVTTEMLARLRLRPGGLVARHVNRHVSIRISRWLLWTPITTNQITTIAGLMALGAAALMLLPGYGWAVAAAALMQLSSIIDGCDGEVARLRYQFSEFGKWYDSAVDEVVNSLFIAATGYHLSLTGWHGWLWVGLFAGAVHYAYGMVNFHCKWRTGYGVYWWFDLGSRPTGPVKPTVTQIGQTNLWSELKTLSGRDAYLLLFLVAALVGGLPVLMSLLGVLSLGVAILLFLHIVVFRAPW